MSRRPERVPWRRILSNAGCVLALAAVGIWAMWPVYESTTFLIAAGTAAIVAVGVPVLGIALRWSTRSIIAVLVGFYALAGIPLTMPTRLSGGTAGIVEALLDLARGPVLGWKDLVTLPMPVGAFRATIVPTFALVLVLTAVATLVSIRSRRWWGVAPLVMALIVVLAAAIGAPTPTAADATWTDVVTGGSWSVGLCTFALCLGWLVWRANAGRREAMDLAAESTVLAVRTRSASRGARSAMAGAAMVAVAVTGALVVGVPTARGESRDVLRSDVDARVEVDTALSPLTTYRTYLDDATFNSVLFQVKVDSGTVDRLRLATLPSYDGVEFSVSPQDSSANNFRQVPARRKLGGDGASVTVTVGDYSAIWAPSISNLSAVAFSGSRRDTLLRGFYYLPSSDAAVMVAGGGLAAGDSYSVTGDGAGKKLDVASIGRSPGAATIDPSLIPESLTTWLGRQHLSSDGTGLAEAVKRLRERGYLSHAATEPAKAPAWQSKLGSYAFAASYAGHSYERIDMLFNALNRREAEVGGDSSASLVAAVGDDEQFASAIALIAAKMGFPSRVVIGVTLTATDASGWAAPPCDGGECRGQNISVWAEVRSAAGQWVPIDATPQHTTPLAPDVTSQVDPKFGSPVDVAEVKTVVPPSSARGDGKADAANRDDGVAVTPWWHAAIRIAGASGLGLAIVALPPVSILVLKVRRRTRRRRGSAADAIHGGWDEYLDAARDAGLVVHENRTRVEVAEELAGVGGFELATLADRATFGDDATSDQDVERCWDVVTMERHAMLAALGWRARLRARFSLKSFTRKRAAEPSPTLVPVVARQDWRGGLTSSHRQGTAHSRLVHATAQSRLKGMRS